MTPITSWDQLIDRLNARIYEPELAKITPEEAASMWAFVMGARLQGYGGNFIGHWVRRIKERCPEWNPDDG